MKRTAKVFAATSALALAAFAGCGGGGDGTSIIGEDTGGSGGMADGAGGGQTGGAGGSVSTGGTGAINAGGTGAFIGSGGTGVGGSGMLVDACASDSVTAEAEAIDMFIMLDQSVSMSEAAGNTTKWDAVKAAIQGFVDNPANTGTRVGIQYFGIVVNSMDSCDPNMYANPDVPIQPLPGVAQAIKDSLNAHGPSVGRFTPTAPAVQGALQHAKQHAAANPDRLTVVVLASDGLPTECSPTSPSAIGDFSEMAATTDPRVLTFVIGIGNAVANLNQIAQKGGTGEAFIITDPANVVQEFSAAMNSIAAKPLACDYPLPMDEDGGTTNPNLVNVVFTPSGGGEEFLLNVEDITKCNTVPGKGWYYGGDKTQIILCQDTCQRLGAGTLKLAVGCSTQQGPS